MMELDRFEIQNGGQQGHAVECDPVFEQMIRQARRAHGAVTFAGDEQRRRPPGVSGKIQPYKLADGLNVALQSAEALQKVGVGGAAVAGSHRIDKHQIRLIQPRLIVVHELVRSGRQASVAVELHSFWSDAPHVQPDRCRARTAVEREHERTFGRVGYAVERVGDIEKIRFDLPLCAADRHHPRGRRVVQSGSVQAQFVFGDDRGLFLQRLCRFRIRLGLLGRRGVGAGPCLWPLGP